MAPPKYLFVKVVELIWHDEFALMTIIDNVSE